MYRDFDFHKKKTQKKDIFNTRPLAEESNYYFSVESYNNDLLRLVDFNGNTPFDWYRNKKTGQIIWFDGHAEIDNYSNLGHTWGKTFANGDRLLLDGDTQLITYNGKVICDFSKKTSKLSGGIAFSDGGNFQDPGSLRRGGVNIPWIDFKTTFEIFLILLAFEFRGSTTNGKGTNEVKPTLDKKADDFMIATDNAANAYKYGRDAVKEQKAKENRMNNDIEKDSVRVTTYDKSGKEIKSEMKAKSKR